MSPESASLTHRGHHRHDVSEDSLAGVAEKRPQNETAWLSPAVFGAFVTVTAVVIAIILVKNLAG
jgi:hypothetical protein